MKNVCVLLATLLAACSSIKVYKNAAFDKTANTIAMPAGTSALNVKLKEFFKSKGFKVIAHAGGEKTEKVSNEKAITTAKNDYRYQVNLDLDYIFEWCWIVQKGQKLNYRINLVDVSSGEEVLSMSGFDCEDNVFSRFTEELGY